MNCPGCNAEPTEVEEDEEQLTVCQECGGLRIGVSDLNRLLLHNGLPGIESLGGRAVPNEGSTAVCRKCMVDMTTFEGGDRKDPLYYEVCEECGSLFVEGKSPPVSGIEAATAELLGFFREFIGKRGAKAR